MKNTKHITKSVYLEFLHCRKNSWLKFNRPELSVLFALSDVEKGRIKEGMEVEKHAQMLFEGGIRIEDSDQRPDLLTKEYIDNKHPVLFQPTFLADQFLVRVDVLKYDDSLKTWDIYEIKGESELKKADSVEIDHIEDVTFQAVVLQKQNVNVGKCFIIHLNKNYTRHDELDITKLFVIEEITEKVREREQKVALKMVEAKKLLLQDDENKVLCLCVYKGRSAHCSSFRFTYENIPEYSVYDIARISKKKLESLIDAGIFELNDIPLNFFSLHTGHELTEIQRNQIDSFKQQKPIVKLQHIQKELSKLEYPLYFLDYETYASAIPLFRGFKPYARMPFQFSLHVLRDAHADPIHFEYLHEANSDSSAYIIAHLKKIIGPRGSIITWYKSFE